MRVSWAVFHAVFQGSGHSIIAGIRGVAAKMEPADPPRIGSRWDNVGKMECFVGSCSELGHIALEVLQADNAWIGRPALACGVLAQGRSDGGSTSTGSGPVRRTFRPSASTPDSVVTDFVCRMRMPLVASSRNASMARVGLPVLSNAPFW